MSQQRVGNGTAQGNASGFSISEASPNADVGGTKRSLQVGIIGASAEGGWARESHVPAVQALSGLELGAVVTTSQASADKAAKAFGARAGYGSAEALFADPAIDIVTVAVKVPHHHDLVLGALRAGKHVYCEWPLSPTLPQAEELAEAASKSGTRVALGLQARFNPSARAAAKLMRDRAIGRVLGVRCYSTCHAWGAEVEPGMVFAEKPEVGVNLIFIQAAHTIDLAIALAGELADVSALAARQFPEPTVKGESRKVQRETFDKILFQSQLKDGGTLNAETTGGLPADATPFELEIRGDAGVLAVTGGAPRGFQSGQMKLTLNGKPYQVNEGELAGLPIPAVNVGGVYAALRDDIQSGSAVAPDFEHAVRLTRLVDDLLASSAEGRRRDANRWPRREGTANA